MREAWWQDRFWSRLIRGTILVLVGVYGLTHGRRYIEWSLLRIAYDVFAFGVAMVGVFTLSSARSKWEA